MVVIDLFMILGMKDKFKREGVGNRKKSVGNRSWAFMIVLS